MHVFSGSGAQGTGHSVSNSVAAASSYLTVDGIAIFSISLQTGGLLIIKLPPFGSPGWLNIMNLQTIFINSDQNSAFT
jgi:hypothetical protein